MAITLKIIGDAKGAIDALEKSEKKVTSLNQAFQLASGVAGIAASAYDKVASAVSFVIDTGSEFENQLATIRGLVGKNDKAFDALRKTAERLGATTQFSATQAAGAFISLSRAGLDTNKILESTNDVLTLAAANNLDLAFAAETVALGLNVFEKQGLKSNEIINELTKTSNSSAQSFGQLTEAFRVAAPTAAAFNIKFGELNSIIGALADTGFKASESGTAIRSTLAKLANPVGEAQKVLEELGLTTKDVSPAFNTFEQILDNVRNAQITTTQATRLLGQEAGSKFISIFTKGGQVLRDFAEKQKEASDASFLQQQRLKTLDGRIALFNSALEASGLILFDAFEPAFKFIVDAGTTVLNFLNTFKSRITLFFTGIKQTALQAGIAIFDGFVGSIGAIKSFLGLSNEAPAFAKRLKSELDEVNDSFDQQRIALTNVINGTEKYTAGIEKAKKSVKETTKEVEKQGKALANFVLTPAEEQLKAQEKIANEQKKQSGFIKSQGRQIAGTVVGVEAGIRGFEQGGALGAVTGVATQILLSNEKFKEQIARLNEAIIELIDPIIEALVPVVDAAVSILKELKPLFEAIGKELGLIVQDIGPVLKELSPVLKELVALIRPALPVIGVIARNLQAIRPISRLVADGLKELSGGINALNGNIEALKKAIENFSLGGGGIFGGGGGGFLGIGGGGGSTGLGFNQGGLITKDRMVRLPGMSQDAGLIKAHEGERVVSNRDQANQGNTFNITVNAGMGSDTRGIENALRDVLERLSSTGRLVV